MRKTDSPQNSTIEKQTLHKIQYKKKQTLEKHDIKHNAND